MTDTNEFLNENNPKLDELRLCMSLFFDSIIKQGHFTHNGKEYEVREIKTVYSIKGLAKDHLANKQFNEFIQNKS